MSNKFIVSIYLSSKNDYDIVLWFNLLRKHGLSISKWVSYIVLSIILNISIDIGSISNSNLDVDCHNDELKTEFSGMMFGSGNSSLDTSCKKISGMYKIGDRVRLRFSSKVVSDFIYDLKNKGLQTSDLLKNLIRKCLRYGEDNVPDEDIFLDSLLKKFFVNKYVLVDKTIACEYLKKSDYIDISEYTRDRFYNTNIQDLEFGNLESQSFNLEMDNDENIVDNNNLNVENIEFNNQVVKDENFTEDNHSMIKKIKNPLLSLININ